MNKLKTRIQNLYDTKARWDAKDVDKYPMKGELLVYDQTDMTQEGNDGTIRLKVGDGETVPKDLPYVTSTPPRTKIGDRPHIELTGPLTYRPGVEVYIKDYIYGYDPSEMVIYGTTEAVNAGVYTAYITPLDGYCWDDGGIDTVVLEWEINKFDITSRIMVYDPVTNENIGYNSAWDVDNVVLSMWNDYQQIRIRVRIDDYVNPLVSCEAKDGPHEDTDIELTSIGTNSYTISVSYKDQDAFKLYFDIAETENYTGASLMFGVRGQPLKTLDECTWDEIEKIADKGNASKYFKVGDKKRVVVQHTPISSTGTPAENPVVLEDLSLFIVGFKDIDFANSRSSIIFGGFIKTVNNQDHFVALRPEDLGYTTFKNDKYYTAPLTNETKENTLPPSENINIEDTPWGKSSAYKWAEIVRRAIRTYEDPTFSIPDGYAPQITISKYCRRNYNTRYLPKDFFKLKLTLHTHRLLPSASEILGNDNIYGDPSIHDDMLEYYDKVKKGTFNAPVYKTYDLKNNINVALRTSSMMEIFYDEWTGGNTPDFAAPSYSGSVSLCYMSTPDIEHDPHTVIIKEDDNQPTSKVGIAPIFTVGGPV